MPPLETVHTFAGNEDAQLAGEALVSQYLWSLPETIDVEDVRDRAAYRREDVDFLWFRRDHRRHEPRPVKVEVKGDRYCPRDWSVCGCGRPRKQHSQNFFLETVSVDKTGAPGCFVSSRADVFAYAFLATGEIHWIPLRPAQKWFDTVRHNYPECPVRNQGYYTRGCKVPRALLADAVEGYELIKPEEWQAPSSPPSPAPASGPPCN